MDGFLFPTRCYAVARDFTLNAEGRVDLEEGLSAATPKFNNKPHLALFSDSDLAERCRNAFWQDRTVILIGGRGELEVYLKAVAKNSEVDSVAWDLNEQTGTARPMQISEILQAIEDSRI